MSNLIVRAEKEVILATNYWENSVASKYITNAMKELSARAAKRNVRVVFKLEYDRGALKQVLDNHYIVPPEEYTGKAVALPSPEDIPNIDLEVMNYHKPMLGTFHCKYMIVDRKYAVLQSNNIQDNDNLEMMTHLEGPIVDSLYDMALLSWNKRLEPMLPCIGDPARITFSGNSQGNDHVPNDRVGQISRVDDDGKLDVNHSESRKIVEAERKELDPHHGNPHDYGEAQHPPRNLERSELLAENMRAMMISKDAEHAVKTKEEHRVEHSSADSGLNDTTHSNMDTSHHNREGPGPDEATISFINSGRRVFPESQILQYTSNPQRLPEHTTKDPHYDLDIAGEIARVQAAVSPSPEHTRLQAITTHLNHTKNPTFTGNPAIEVHTGDEMTPYIPHALTRPFPIALVNRAPHGAPNHNAVHNPQNAAWLSAINNAQKSIFIQTPTLNASPLIPALKAACEKGVDVFCYVCLGYNDSGELLPFQGGTNEMIAHQLHASLSTSAKQKLHYFWYVAKDQTVPLVASKKVRSCHIKLMIVDERIGIQGNGNQDTQSWYHSQEINILIESEEVCKGWIEGLRRNQNTHLFGSLGKEDGVWRDTDGTEADAVIGVDPGRFSWVKGVVGAVNRVRGTGGF